MKRANYRNYKCFLFIPASRALEKRMPFSIFPSNIRLLVAKVRFMRQDWSRCVVNKKVARTF